MLCYRPRYTASFSWLKITCTKSWQTRPAPIIPHDSGGWSGCVFIIWYKEIQLSLMGVSNAGAIQGPSHGDHQLGNEVLSIRSRHVRPFHPRGIILYSTSSFCGVQMLETEQRHEYRLSCHEQRTDAHWEKWVTRLINMCFVASSFARNSGRGWERFE